MKPSALAATTTFQCRRRLRRSHLRTWRRRPHGCAECGAGGRRPPRCGGPSARFRFRRPAGAGGPCGLPAGRPEDRLRHAAAGRAQRALRGAGPARRCLPDRPVDRRSRPVERQLRRGVQARFLRLPAPGTYRIKIISPAAAVSPAFAIASPQALYRRLVLNGVRYFTSERDGANVVRSVLNRRPANLTDRRAFVYADPRYDRNDNLLGTFHRIGRPVNVAGGWFDAGGGYEKFAYTASYADALMMTAERDFPGRYPTLRPEAEFGLRWIGRLCPG
jgi:hypothetical protein